MTEDAMVMELVARCINAYEADRATLPAKAPVVTGGGEREGRVLFKARGFFVRLGPSARKADR